MTNFLLLKKYVLFVFYRQIRTVACYIQDNDNAAIKPA